MYVLSLFLLQSQQNLAKIFQSNYFFFMLPSFYALFISSATAVFNCPLRVRNTDQSTFRMQTRMLARDHSYFLLDSCSTSHLFPYTGTTPHLPVSGIKPSLKPTPIYSCLPPRYTLRSGLEFISPSTYDFFSHKEKVGRRAKGSFREAQCFLRSFSNLDKWKARITAQSAKHIIPWLEAKLRV